MEVTYGGEKVLEGEHTPARQASRRSVHLTTTAQNPPETHKLQPRSLQRL